MNFPLLGLHKHEFSGCVIINLDEPNLQDKTVESQSNDFH